MSEGPVYNADRKHAMRQVELALKDGRIDFEDYDELTKAIAEADDHATLDHIVQRSRELSTTGTPVKPQSMGTQLQRTGPENASSFFGDLTRQGRWTVMDGSTYTATFGEVLLDMREATASSPEVTLNTSAYLGNVCVIVSPGVEVVNQINNVFGEVKDKSQPGVRGAARIILHGTCFMGSVKIISLPSGAKVPFGFKHL